MSERFALMLIAELDRRIDKYPISSTTKIALIEYRNSIHTVMKAMGYTLK